MTLYSAAITLILVMDPIGNIPAFLSILQKVDIKRRKKIILREMIIALLVLLIFLFFGKNILAGFNISQSALRVGGGIILFLIALKMIFPDSHREEETDKEPMIVPMAIPLVAGPSAMTIVTLFGTQYPDKINLWLTALLIAWLVSSLALLSSDFLRKLLGDKILKAVEKLMGMILVTMSIQMLLDGIANFWKDLI